VQFTVPDEDTGLNAAAALPSDAFPHIPDFDRATPTHASLLDRGVAVRAALKAGLLGVFIGMIPVLGIVLTGSLGVFFYRRAKGTAPATRIGARVGAAAGVVSFAINSLMIVVRIFSLHAQQEYIDAVTKVAQAVGYNTADPLIQASIRNLVSPAGLALTFFFGMAFTVLLSALGGALAALLFRPSSRS
jgi:MFS family permease